MAAITPVPGRVCGPCNACCIVPEISTDELVKPAGKRCEHLLYRGGCSIPAIWPKVCKEFFCGWRLMPQLGDEWRPDLSGVMLTAPGGEVPNEMVAMGAIKIILIERRACNWRPLLEFVRDRVQTDIPVYVTVAGSEGKQTYTGFINYELKERPKDVVDVSAVITCLQTAFDQISAMMNG